MPVLYLRDENGNFVPIKTTKGADGKSAYESAIEGGFIGTYEEFCQAIAELTPNTEHTENKENPHAVTAEQVGSLKVYSGFSAINAELGKEFNSDTPLADIIKAMPDNTGLVADIREPQTGVYPTKYGTLTIYKIREQRVSVMYKDWSAYILWLGDYTTEDGFKGFKRIITDNSEHPLTFDNADLGVPIVMKNGNSYYAIEKHRFVNGGDGKSGRPCKMDVGLGVDPCAVLQLFIGDEGAEEVPNEYTQRLALRYDGLEFAKRNEDNSISKYKIHGEHNKPSDTYTGNGEAREINIGGVGSFLVIYGEYSVENRVLAVVGANGGVKLSYSISMSGNVLCVDKEQARYKDGKLYLRGGDANNLNFTDGSYTYQVL